MAKIIGYANGNPIHESEEEASIEEEEEGSKGGIRPDRFEWKEGDLVQE